MRFTAQREGARPLDVTLNLPGMHNVANALAAIAVGLVGGLLQGVAITKLKVPAFVVTLGGMSVFRGAALLFAAGGPISGFEPSFSDETFSATERTQVVIYLQPRQTAKFETVIRRKRAKKEVAKVSLSRDEVKRVPGTFGDPGGG
jgi:ABC-type xylose transport system permease subunit